MEHHNATGNHQQPDVISKLSDKQDQKYFLTVDPRKVKSKPTEEEKQLITRNLTLVTGLTINEFSQIITPPNSMTWTGGIFNGTRKNSSWIKQSVFAVDFDNGDLTIEQAIDRIRQFDILPQLWYTTFSDSPKKRKFRLVFFLESPIEDIELHKLIVTGLMKLYPEADPSCKDRSRIFFGGKKCSIIHNNPISNDSMIDAMSIQLVTSDSNSFRKIPLSTSYYTSLKSAEKRTFLCNIYRSCQISAGKKNIPTSMKGGVQERIEWSIAKQRVRILREFLEGKWLYHMELFGLATNLIYIKGGMKLMKDTMIKYNKEGKTHYTQNNFNIIPYVNKVKYPAKQLYKFSPFEEDHQYYDIISAAKETRGEVEIIKPIQKIELQQADQILKDSYKEVMANGSCGKIYLFNLPTAIGKTETIVSTEEITLSLPTNELKNEIAGRMKVKFNTTPDPVDFEDLSLNQKLNYYYNIGLPNKSTAVLYDMIKPANAKKYSQSDIKKAENYLSKLKGSINSNDAVLTTHSRVLHTGFKHNTVIFDEDPLNHLIDIKQLHLSDLYRITVSTANIYKSDLDPVINFLASCSPGEIKVTPTFTIELDELINKLSEIKIDSNIFEFFASSYFIRDIQDPNCFHYVVKREIPTDKKVLIMSASIPNYIYERLFGNRIISRDVRDVQQQGSVIQYTNRSCSRNSLNRYGGQISDEIGDKPVITFKSFAHQFKNPAKNIHFGNCSGYDTLKGKDIAIVGTPHRNNIEYFLTAKVCGIDFKTTDTTMIYQKIDYNGFRFKFNCFENEELRKIQLSFIESDLIQAVGRARTLRTDARVEVYSNFPLRISDTFIY